ncbi:MAG TPA: 16S rRNA (adenine(1518)-N(6)/adenine(1519)-N(6))-dimethyltransferase RsmA [Candidatus Kryptonia bacterium]
MKRHIPKKSLGQNFLMDMNIAAKIVDALSPEENDFVVEIGPGKGALTRILAERGIRIETIEKDDELAAGLATSFRLNQNVKAIQGDFLEYDFPITEAPIKVIGNIPYNLTSEIVSKLVDERDRIYSAVLMVQDEVAARLSAKSGGKEYGALSIRLQLVADVEKLFLVPPTCFRPMPRVNSRVIRISFGKRRAIATEKEFVTFVKRAFGMRRKMFRHFVSHYYGKPAANALDEKWKTRRVETFSPEEIYSLFESLEKKVEII